MSIVYFLWISSILHLSGCLRNYWDGLQKMLDNSSSKTVMSGVCLDFQLVAPRCVFQVFFRITVQNQIGIAKRVIVDEII